MIWSVQNRAGLGVLKLQKRPCWYYSAASILWSITFYPQGPQEGDFFPSLHPHVLSVIFSAYTRMCFLIAFADMCLFVLLAYCCLSQYSDVPPHKCQSPRPQAKLTLFCCSLHAENPVLPWESSPCKVAWCACSGASSDSTNFVLRLAQLWGIWSLHVGMWHNKTAQLNGCSEEDDGRVC